MIDKDRLEIRCDKKLATIIKTYAERKGMKLSEVLQWLVDSRIEVVNRVKLLKLELDRLNINKDTVIYNHETGRVYRKQTDLSIVEGIELE